MRWALDRDGIPRAVSNKGPVNRVFYRRDDKSPWIKWSEGDFGNRPAGRIRSVMTAVFLASASRTGEARLASSRLTAALLRFDERGQTQAVLAHRDVMTCSIPSSTPSRRSWLVSAIAVSDRRLPGWTSVGHIAAAIRPATAERSELLRCHQSRNKRMLVYSFSDRLPGAVYLFDFQTSKLEYLIDARPLKSRR